MHLIVTKNKLSTCAGACTKTMLRLEHNVIKNKKIIIK